MSDVPVSLSLGLPLSLAFDEAAATTPAQESLEVLFREYRPRLLRYLACMGLSLQDGEEIVQEVFLALFQHLRLDKPRQNLRGWIFRVAHNLGLKKRMLNRSRDLTQEVSAPPSIEMRDPAPSPEEQAIWKQQQKRLLAALEALPAQDRSCLYLRAEGLRYREICEVLDISLGSVCQSLSRAITRLNHVYHR